MLRGRGPADTRELTVRARRRDAGTWPARVSTDAAAGASRAWSEALDSGAVRWRCSGKPGRGPGRRCPRCVDDPVGILPQCCPRPRTEITSRCAPAVRWRRSTALKRSGLAAHRLLGAGRQQAPMTQIDPAAGLVRGHAYVARGRSPWARGAACCSSATSTSAIRAPWPSRCALAKAAFTVSPGSLHHRRPRPAACWRCCDELAAWRFARFCPMTALCPASRRRRRVPCAKLGGDRDRVDHRPQARLGLILGSGLGSFADDARGRGHHRLWRHPALCHGVHRGGPQPDDWSAGREERAWSCIAMQGRIHMYEGHSRRPRSTFPVRVHDLAGRAHAASSPTRPAVCNADVGAGHVHADPRPHRT